MLWIVDGGMLTLPVEGRVEDWRKGESITVTHGANGEWTDTVTYDARGECHMKHMWSDPDDGDCWECSKCGRIVLTDGYDPRYCTQCGAKVVVE